MSRRRSHRNALICAAGGVALSLVLHGCGRGGGEVRAPNTDTPVNTGLSSIDGAPALGLPDRDELMRPNRDEEMIRAQIEESARQLSVYFTNLELDGPPSSGDTSAPVPTARTGGGQQPVEQRVPAREPEPRIAARESANRAQPNPEVVRDEDDGGVRVSLMDLAGGVDGSEGLASGSEGSPVALNEPSNGGEAEAAGGESGATDGPVQSAEPEIERDPRARRDMLARELASILSELVESGQDPGASALALATLEMLLPDDTGVLVDSGVLSEPERASIDAVRSLLGAMTSEGEIVSPGQMSERLGEIQLQVDAWAGLTIRKAALCTRVDGYGRYETFPSYRFVAGQAQEVIVYTELERFSQRETTGPDGQPRFSMELSQRLELYHVADDLNTWNRGAETVRDESRNRLRDYYLTNRVFLPANLGVGRYHLKVVMRDLIGEKVAETIIPIEIVAR